MADPFVSTWDTGQPGATWDSGLQFDVNVGPSPGDISKYLALVTSEHRDKAKYIAWLSVLLQPLADIITVVESIPGLFDLNTAVAAQLDVVGQWVGASRNISVPFGDVYFELDSAPLGLDMGSMQGPDDSLSGLVVLPDSAYRTLIRAKIAQNQWDGTVESAYAIYDTIGLPVLIQDEGGMHMIFALLGGTPDALTIALLTGGYLTTRPAGVEVDAYYTPGAPNVPYFGLDTDGSGIAGLDTGSFGISYIPA